MFANDGWVVMRGRRSREACGVSDQGVGLGFCKQGEGEKVAERGERRGRMGERMLRVLGGA